MAGFKLENTLSQRCMQTQLCEINDKLDYIIKKINDMDGIKGFGVNLAANVIGNLLDSGKK